MKERENEYRWQQNWCFRSAHKTFISSLLSPMITYTVIQVKSCTSPSIIPRDTGVAPCLRTIFSIYRSAFKLEDGFETICQQGMENLHLVRKLVSIRTNGVPLFSIFPKCSPIRNGDAKEETHRCCIGVYLWSPINILKCCKQRFLPSRFNMRKRMMQNKKCSVKC